MKKRLFFIYSIALIILNFTSCKESGVNEGILKYHIEYDEQEKKTNAVINLLPTQMSYYFKDGSSKSMMSFMGFFLAAYISNAETKENIILFKLMNDKYSCTTNFGEGTIGFDDFPNMVLKETKETKVMEGLKARKVEVSFKDNSMEPFDLYYTSDIKVENPNWNNPYRDIKGVPLDFRLKLMGISMHLTLKEMRNEVVDMNQFTSPEGYALISAEELDKTIREILQSAGK